MGDWNAAFTIITWWLWKWRNDEIFYNKTKSTKQKTDWIRAQWKEIVRVFMKNLKPGDMTNKKEKRWLCEDWREAGRMWSSHAK